MLEEVFFMNKVNTIFFDIDGTIYDADNNRIPPMALKALQEIQKKGIKIFLATGRSLPAVLESKLDKDILWDGYVCSNGACLHDQTKKLIHGSFFSEYQLNQLFTLIKQYDMGLSIQSPDIVYSPFGINQDMIEAFEFFNNPVPQPKPYENEQIAMALAFQKKGFDFKVLETIENIITVEGKSNYADVMQKGVTKATGIRTIRHLLGLDDGLIMSFGDADNDLEMIKNADIGIAMGNATDAVKEIADHITTAIDDDGIYNALKYYTLI